jgi:hypothetical protein
MSATKKSIYRSVFRLLQSNRIVPEGFAGSDSEPTVKLDLAPSQAGKIVEAVRRRRRSLGYEYAQDTGRMTIWGLR